MLCTIHNADSTRTLRNNERRERKRKEKGRDMGTQHGMETHGTKVLRKIERGRERIE